MQLCQNVNKNLCRTLLPLRAETGNKGTFGTLLALCGSRDMPGAALLSGQAALRCGVGLLALAAPESVLRSAAMAMPEAVHLPMETDRDGLMTTEWFSKHVVGYSRANAVLFGCGLGRGSAANTLCTRLLRQDTRPLVIDADGLFALSQTMLHGTFDRPVILTPHIGEMARLTGLDISYIKEHRAQCACDLAQARRCVVVLKDYVTVIAAPDGRSWLLDRPNSGMAKGGSGDVLAGCIAALLAQGLPAADAAILGVYLHSRAGELAANRYGTHAMLPRDVIEHLPAAWLELEQ